MSESQLALNNFKKDTKRDITAYPSFKYEMYYDSFHHAFHATAKAQWMGNIIDPKLFPKCSDTHGQLLFDEQHPSCTLFWSFHLQTECRNELVKEGEDDAQIILLELHQHHTNSETAQDAIVELTSYITNLCLTDTWKGLLGKEPPSSSLIISRRPKPVG